MTPLAAYADMAVEPGNNFFKQHQNQIIFLGRSFAANGENGSVAVKKAPGARGNMARIKNGEVIFISSSCLYDGDFWGFTFAHSGWIKLEQMLVLYDYVAFEEDHLDELYYYTGDYAEIKETRSAIAWPWPGADALLWTFEDLDAENFTVSCTYKDHDGREWGFVTYLYGSRNIWVCLSDPLNRDIPVFNPAPAPMPWVSETVHVDIGKSGNTLLVLIVVLVAALVIGTGVLIKAVWKLDRGKPGGKSSG
jgi:hypothetical protein